MLRDNTTRLPALQDKFFALIGGTRCSSLFRGWAPAGRRKACTPTAVLTQALSHDLPSRCANVLPERRRIDFLTGSIYEELAAVRVHGSLLEYERLPPRIFDSDLWELMGRSLRR
jgi:hypothetical protein